MITKEEVQHVAKLARVSLTKEEERKFQKDLSSILDYFNLLKKININQVPTTSHAIGVKNVVREDKVQKEREENIEKLIEVAPEQKDKYFKVKSIFP